jgi:hypothetical protein
MVRSLLRPTILMLMLGSGIMCQPRKIDPPTLTGKLVIAKPCSNYVIQVLQGSIEPSALDPLWKDTVSGITYVNVFTVANLYHFLSSFAEGDTITFQLGYGSDPPIPLCDPFAFYPSPPVSNPVRNVQKRN